MLALWTLQKVIRPIRQPDRNRDPPVQKGDREARERTRGGGESGFDIRAEVPGSEVGNEYQKRNRSLGSAVSEALQVVTQQRDEPKHRKGADEPDQGATHNGARVERRFARAVTIVAHPHRLPDRALGEASTRSAVMGFSCLIRGLVAAGEPGWM